MKTLADYLLAALTNSVQIEIKETDEKKLIRFVITDNGEGMEKAFVKTAAQPGITTKEGENRGMGLYLIKNLSEECSGMFQLSSHKGKSTRLEYTVKKDSEAIKPIGDIAGVVAEYIYSHPDILVWFEYATDKKKFMFSLPSMRFIYSLPHMNTSADKQKLKKIFQKNLERIEYNSEL